MAIDARARCDRYWQARDVDRTEARSRERARIALSLLWRAGLERGRVIDLGCGPGWTLDELRAAGFDASGVDASATAVAAARARGHDAREVDLEAMTAEQLLAGAPRFDGAVCLEVLEHLVDPLEALDKLFGVTRPGGPVVVSLPNEVSLPARLRVLFGRLPFGGHDDPHVRHFDRAGALRLLAAAGASVIAERAVSVLPPRWPVLRAAARPALALLPGVLAIATVYLLRRPAEGDRSGA